MRSEYSIFWAKAHWANHFAIFVEKVLNACYGDNWRENPDAKVDVVAHSMGGLVVRAAIKWYEMPCGEPVKERVRKLITIGTPNFSLRDLRVEIKLSVEEERWV